MNPISVNRLQYFSAALIICIVSGILGAWFYLLDTNHYSYLFTLYPSSTQVDISSSNDVWAIGIFLCGASFSAGLSMIINLFQPERRSK